MLKLPSIVILALAPYSSAAFAQSDSDQQKEIDQFNAWLEKHKQ